MKCLVTGGAGFIGSHIVDALFEAGHEVVVVDDLSTGKRANLNPHARFYEMDIRSPELPALFAREKPDVVSHQAAQMDVRRAVREPAFDASVNVIGALNVLESARHSGVQKILFASTGGAVYGEPEHVPVEESHPIAPMSPYGLTKYTFEQYLGLYRRLYGMAYVALRYPNVYGPRQDPHGEAGVVAIFTRQMLAGEQPIIFGDGSKSRDYVHVSDVAAATRMLVAYGDEGSVFNLGFGLEVTDRMIFDAVRDALGVKVEPRFGEVRPGEVSRIALDASRIRAARGWQPTLGYREGIARTVEWYKANPA
ncbi:MAG: NAD-dependent epimerase/dehydratase family protein [Proteobacteria bacterium]|nr:NAD-dependent epimerase/dehydratase family protein [Pseudomonadota bacterium]MBK8960365.1 NAD-dependent epimerase/dehydratase family protein [Pseudomonadota bacterium]